MIHFELFVLIYVWIYVAQSFCNLGEALLRGGALLKDTFETVTAILWKRDRPLEKTDV